MKTNCYLFASPAPGMILYRFGRKWVNWWYIIGVCLVLLAVFLIPISAQYAPSMDAHMRLVWRYIVFGILVVGCVMTGLTAIVSEFRPPRKMASFIENRPSKESSNASLRS